MKAQEVELALEEVEKAGEEQAKFGKCLGEKIIMVLNSGFHLFTKQWRISFNILGWPKSKILWTNPNKLSGQPNIL